MKLIDKDAVMAEIKSKIEKYTKRGEESDAKRDGYGMYWGGVLSCLNEVRTLLCDTLEVIEVDFEKELENYWPSFITTQDLIKEYVSDRAANRWLNASEVEQLLNDFVLDYDIIKNREYEQQCKCKSK